MAVYVDELTICTANKNWRWGKSCHLVADTLEELHSFADRLGLKASWFQNSHTIPHYDLTGTKRTKAVRLGAIEVDRETFVQILHRIRWIRSII